MFEKSIFMTIILLGLEAFLPGQPPGGEVVTLPGDVTKVHLREDGSFYVMVKDLNVLQRFSASGELVEVLGLESTTQWQVRSVLDFTVDTTGGIHVLAVEEPQQGNEVPSIVILRFGQDEKTYEVVRPDRSFQAWRIGIDESYNYYLLGVETGVHFRIVEQDSSSETFSLIHKLLPDGNYASSSFHIGWPSSREEYRTFIWSGMVRKNNFVVLDDGSVGYLWIGSRAKDMPSSQWDRRLFVVVNGEREQISPVPPATEYQLFGILGNGSDIFIDWLARKRPSMSALIVTRLGGGEIFPISEEQPVPGRTMAIRGDQTLTVLRVSDGTSRVYLNQIESP